MRHLMVLVAGELYAAYAGLTYWRLRTGHMPAEITGTRSWIRCTRPWHWLAPVLLPARPVIAELTCVINGLLWPIEWVTRPWRS